MGHFILVTLVMCASALVESNKVKSSPKDLEVPPYHQSARDFLDASKKVLELSPPEGGVNPEKLDVDDKRLHYGMLVAVVDELTEALYPKLCGHTYDEYYNTAVNKGVSRAWSHPLEVGSRLKYQQQTLENDLRKVLDLVKVECELPIIDCDLKVEAAVKLHPQKYERQAELLLTVGKLSKVYLSDTYANQAETYDVLRLLVTTGRNDLRALVAKNVDVRHQHEFGGKKQEAVDCKKA